MRERGREGERGRERQREGGREREEERGRERGKKKFILVNVKQKIVTIFFIYIFLRFVSLCRYNSPTIS